jgi:hypothetical protein
MFWIGLRKENERLKDENLRLKRESLETIESIKKVCPSKDDLIVIKADNNFTEESYKRLKEAMASIFKGKRKAILLEGCELSVLDMSPRRG